MMDCTERYEKQITVPVFGEEGQRKLASANVAIIGVGALGCFSSQYLIRMGLGQLRIADGDTVSFANLHRQILFSEKDAVQATPKVDAAVRELRRFQKDARILGVRNMITRENIADFVADSDLILDATDSMPTRFVINDFAVRRNVPWIYTGVAGTEGIVMPIIPGIGPCLRCLFPDEPDASQVANCKQNGILPITPGFAVSIQIAQAIRILLGTVTPGIMIRFSVWDGVARSIRVSRNAHCPVCHSLRP